LAGRITATGIKDSAMTRETIDYARLGVEACQAYTEGPTAFADFVRTILSVAASQHVLQTTTTGKPPERVDFAHYSRRDIDGAQRAACGGATSRGQWFED
jgi:hypothetical protein